ncbi:major royal jelly family protein [Streptomyces sp. DSM 40750]|uniref:major royal jelly family protein n=1 Tax=Streptomyces sp. DSM 40750 TaxID=2801030 RepID=UPI00214BE0EF|nr:major royal jelly family protein [Streptomyces sp. DSM 40750]UUU19604.1 major royal jelly family protein [Streptomyces sp. DSM 40750]UUU27053.1 major royal jelly family protein [Streptomyces sp. DSM 40750]
MKRRTFLTATTASLAATQLAGPASASTSTSGSTAKNYEVVARFWGAMPTGVTVSRRGRIFVNFPRWGDDVPFTVAELRGGKPVAYPDAEVNRQDASDLAGHFQSVQSVVVDAADRLWILDTGSPLFAGSSYGGPKLVAVDLRTDRIVRKILFPPEVVPANSYPNDVRLDLRRGAEGTAFITDSGGSNGIIVVDLATGRSWRRLTGHPSALPDKDFLPIIDGEPFMVRPAGGEPVHYETGSDGIALSADGTRLYYCPLSSRRLHSVSTDALADPHATDTDVAATVEDHGFKPMADGLESDDKGRLYGGDLEHNTIWRRNPNGTYQTLAQGADLLWTDTLSIATDRHLYAIANQLNRLSPFHEGQDLRRKPYLLIRLPINAGPVRLV